MTAPKEPTWENMIGASSFYDWLEYQLIGHIRSVWVDQENNPKNKLADWDVTRAAKVIRKELIINGIVADDRQGQTTPTVTMPKELLADLLGMADEGGIVAVYGDRAERVIDEVEKYVPDPRSQ